MVGPVEEKPFTSKVSAEEDHKGSGGWRLYDSADQQVAVIVADADRLAEIVRLINTSVESCVAQHLDDTLPPLTMEFEDGELVKVCGARPDYLDRQTLIRLVKRLAKLNLAQEQEIGRYKAEVEDLYAQADREHSKRLAAEVIERRDIAAMAAMIGLISTQSSSSFAQDAKNAFDAAEAFECERAVRS